MNRRVLAALAVVASPCIALAQFNQSIAVEGKYVPEVFKLERINAFPKLVRPSVETSPLAYDGKSVPADFKAKLLPMPATGWRDIRNYSRNKGYLVLGAGSWLNSDLSAGYRFVDNESTQFGAWLQHNSTSLWKPEVSERTADQHQQRYDETLGFYGMHEFKGKGTLNAEASWHIGNFNYYGTHGDWDYTMGIPADTESGMKFPTQTLNDVVARVEFSSDAVAGAPQWNVAAGVRYFGYRAGYSVEQIPTDELTYTDFRRYKGGRETDVNIAGGVMMPLAETSAIGLDLNFNHLSYSHVDQMPGNYASNYAMVTLTPYYRFTRDRLLVRAGLDVDLAFNARYGNDKYSMLHIAPDVKFDFQASPVNFYLHLLGGSTLNTLADGFDTEYYQSPGIGRTTPTYVPLDGKLGINFGPFSGFTAGAEIGYKFTRGEYLTGWYQRQLNTASVEYNEDLTINIHGCCFGLNLGYDLGDMLKVSAKGSYQPQNGEKGYFNGIDRPRWLLDLEASTNPWRKLKLTAAYHYRGVRTIYTKVKNPASLNMEDYDVRGLRLQDITNLCFGASYGFSNNFDVWLQADNLLNRHTEIIPDLPQQGVSITAGVSLRF